MESSDQKVWVKYGTGRAVEVSVSPECNVNGLIEAIKGKLSRKLVWFVAEPLCFYEYKIVLLIRRGEISC